jgi:hypothetical protein
MHRYLATVAAAGLLVASATPGLAADTCAERMKEFNAKWNATTPGHKTPDAQRAYAAAQAALQAKNEKECLARLRQAGDAMK